MIKNKNNSLSYDAKLAITLISLFSVYPLGLIFMYMWMNWPKWLKTLITLPAVFAFIIGFIVAIDFSRSIKEEQEQNARNELRIKEAERILNCRTQCAEDESVEYNYCVDECLD